MADLPTPLFLSIPETAHALGVGPTTVKKLISEQRLQSCKIGGRRLVATDAVRAFAESVSREA